MSPRCSSKSTKNTGIDSYLFYFCNMKALYILFGTLSLILGIIGIFLPLLPTTPFLLLTAALYVRSSPRLYNWLLHQKYLGNYIRNFRENKAIPLRAKIVSVSLIPDLYLSVCGVPCLCCISAGRYKHKHADGSLHLQLPDVPA